MATLIKLLRARWGNIGERKCRGAPVPMGAGQCVTAEGLEVESGNPAEGRDPATAPVERSHLPPRSGIKQMRRQSGTKCGYLEKMYTHTLEGKRIEYVSLTRLSHFGIFKVQSLNCDCDFGGKYTRIHGDCGSAPERTRTRMSMKDTVRYTINSPNNYHFGSGVPKKRV